MFRKFAGLTAIAGLFIAGAASAGVENSVHDFRAEITSNSELCGYCHVPHAADATVTDAPLWDHDLSSKVYTPYSSGTMGTAMSGNAATWGISRLCVSCHDGVTAVDSYGGGAATTTILDVPAWISVGANYSEGVNLDISQEHPVSVPASGDALVKDPPDDTRTAFFGGNVECASCHDVHDQAGTSFLLVMDNAGSAMCLSCHDK
jgi:predicted CXXCH cytochrome family protein